MTDALVVLLVILPPIDWLVAIIIGHASRRHPHILVLRERAIAAVVAAIVASIAGLLAWSRLGFFDVTGDTALTMLAFGLVLASVPSLYWLSLLITGRFHIGGEG
jgi:hypothetical protein